MIDLRHITKIYRTKTGSNVVLRDISISFAARESIGIIGRNGAGKSTLLRIIGGAEMPTSGTVSRAGRVSWPIGFGGGFAVSLTGEENCRFVARIYGQEVDRVVDETRDFADLGDYFDEPIRTYSSGMRARLAFGLSMAIDFDFYLVDEVISVGDAQFREKCRRAFTDRRQRAGLIMVSHQMNTLSEYCRRFVVLDKGVFRLFDRVDDATRAYEERPNA